MAIAFQAPRELRELYIGAPLSEFPKSIGRLKHLEKIVVENTNLKSLPEEFGQLWSLKYLCIYGADLVSLPDTFPCLSNLQQLKLLSCRSLLELPYYFSSLENLQSLNLSACSNLRRLPQCFELLTDLEHLDLSMCSKLELDVKFPPNLLSLKVNDCPLQLQQNPEVAKVLMDIETRTTSNTISSATLLPLDIDGTIDDINRVLSLGDGLRLENRGVVEEQLNRLRGFVHDIKALFRDQQREIPAALKTYLRRLDLEVVRAIEYRYRYRYRYRLRFRCRYRYRLRFRFRHLYLYGCRYGYGYFYDGYGHGCGCDCRYRYHYRYHYLYRCTCRQLRFIFPPVAREIQEWNTTVNGIVNELLLICDAPQVVSAAPQQEDVLL